MTTSDSATGPAPRVPGSTDRITAYLWIFRVLAILQAAAILTQAVTAGQLLSGTDGMRDAHGSMASLVLGTGLLELVAAILLWRPGRGPGWPAIVSLVLLLAGVGQTMAGEGENLAVHVPLGMGLFGIAVWLAVWSLRAGPSQRAVRAAEPAAAG